MPMITQLCEYHKVKFLYAFGSVLTDKFDNDNDSDIDLIVEFLYIPVEDYADNYYALKFSLQDIFGCPVDLLEEQVIRNPYLKRNIDQNKQLVYER
jgi:predicted nucleotidyltransferase